LNAEEFCAEIVEVNERHGVKPRWYVIDPSARNKQHATGRSIQDEYRRCGIHTIPGQNSHDAGFERISRLLKGGPANVPVGEREPRLVIQAHCSNPDDDELPGLVEEFPMYRWAQRRQGEGASPQKPIKVNDDAARRAPLPGDVQPDRSHVARRAGSAADRPGQVRRVGSVAQAARARHPPGEARETAARPTRRRHHPVTPVSH
jgi:hypothetical protein